MIHWDGTAVAVFGSVARNDTDFLSDRDILLVNEQYDCLRSGAARCKRMVRSPILYSWQRLDTAANRGDLFILHLEAEATRLHDANDLVAHMLFTFNTK